MLRTKDLINLDKLLKAKENIEQEIQDLQDQKEDLKEETMYIGTMHSLEDAMIVDENAPFFSGKTSNISDKVANFVIKMDIKISSIDHKIQGLEKIRIEKIKRIDKIVRKIHAIHDKDIRDALKIIHLTGEKNITAVSGEIGVVDRSWLYRKLKKRFGYEYLAYIKS